MSDNNTTQDTAQLTKKKSWRISPVWLIPVAALLIGAWLLYDHFASHGPTIYLKIDTAEGIQAGKTELKIHNVPVGQVTDVSLSDDYKHAILEVEMDQDTQDLLGDDTQFWLVKPRIGPQGVSGLNTLVSGSYLQMRPGESASQKRHFQVQENPPPTPSDKPGITVKLVDSGNNVLSVGDPIIYQGHNVGQIEDSQFSVKKRETTYTVFVKKPYSKLITENTQFWLRSGIDMHLGTSGLDVQLGSLQSILAGGITFDHPDGVQEGDRASDNAYFKLYQNANDATEDRYNRKLHYIMLLDDSVRGLSEGAPVEYRGLRIGTVEKVPFYPRSFSYENFTNFKIPILIAIEPQRPSLSWIDWSDEEWFKHNQKFFQKGMRATIKPSNLLTGAMLIDISFDKNSAPFKKRKLSGYPVFPSEPSQITSIQQQLSDLMDKLNQLDIKPLLNQLQNASKQTSMTLTQVHQISRKLNKLMSQPGVQELPDQLNDTLEQLQDTLHNFQEGSAGYQQLNSTIDRLNKVLDNADPLSRTLRDHPNSLIFGRPHGKDPVPKANP